MEAPLETGKDPKESPTLEEERDDEDDEDVVWCSLSFVPLLPLVRIRSFAARPKTPSSFFLFNGKTEKPFSPSPFPERSRTR